MVVQNQIKRTLSRELDRLHAVMRREKFAHRTALADRVCSEFGFHDARVGGHVKVQEIGRRKCQASGV